MSARLYGFASGTGLDTGLIRFGGMGLGNLLFSWARCSLFCKAHDAKQIYTTWPQLKRRGWIHRERDKRHYVGLFRARPDEIAGLNKLKLLYSCRKTEEADWAAGPHSDEQIVIFRGLKNYFQDIPTKDHCWIKSRLLSAFTDQRVVSSPTVPHIGVHVRLGDFFSYDPGVNNLGNMRLPLTWYTHVVKLISTELNWSGEIGVCSDAGESELKPLLQIPKVRLVRGRTAQEDLIYLAKSRLVIGSVSTFSQWAAYLSGRPSIWHPGFNRRGGLGNGSLEVVMSEDVSLSRGEWNALLDLVTSDTCIFIPESTTSQYGRLSVRQ